MLGKGRLYVLAAAGVTALAVGSYAVAGSLSRHDEGHGKTRFHATLEGFEEVPSVSSTGWGEFDARLVEDEKIHFVFRYAGLEGGDSLFAHVHFGQLSVNGGVSFFLCGGSTKPTPCPNVEGTVEGDITPADVIGPNGQGIEPGSFGEIVRAMRAGYAYVNIHTTRWPGGEIRGQISAKHDDDDRGDRGKDDDKSEIGDRVKDELEDVKAEIKDALKDEQERIRDKVRKAFDQ
jgi:hypothetical protein